MSLADRDNGKRKVVQRGEAVVGRNAPHRESSRSRRRGILVVGGREWKSRAEKTRRAIEEGERGKD